VVGAGAAMEARKDPREAARAYLAKHKVDHLFHELGSALLFHRPGDVRAFLLAELKALKDKRAARAQSSLFTDEDLGTIYDMYNTQHAAGLSPEQCHAALKVIGAGPEAAELVDRKSGQVARDSFITMW
jgi:hypothetical protein